MQYAIVELCLDRSLVNVFGKLDAAHKMTGGTFHGMKAPIALAFLYCSPAL